MNPKNQHDKTSWKKPPFLAHQLRFFASKHFRFSLTTHQPELSWLAVFTSFFCSDSLKHSIKLISTPPAKYASLLFYRLIIAQTYTNTMLFLRILPFPMQFGFDNYNRNNNKRKPRLFPLLNIEGASWYECIKSFKRYSGNFDLSPRAL